jgi:hypothetical protein
VQVRTGNFEGGHVDGSNADFTLSQASQDVCYSYVCLGKGSSARLIGCRIWIAVSNTLHKNEPCIRARQLTLHAWQWISMLFARCILVAFVPELGEVTACSRSLARMYFIRIQLRARTRQENQECCLSHQAVLAPSQVWTTTSQPRKIGLLRIQTQHQRVSYPTRSSVVLSLCRGSSHHVALVDGFRTSHNFEEHSESQRTLSALSTKRHTVVRSGMIWFLAVILWGYAKDITATSYTGGPNFVVYLGRWQLYTVPAPLSTLPEQEFGLWNQ